MKYLPVNLSYEAFKTLIIFQFPFAGHYIFKSFERQSPFASFSLSVSHIPLIDDNSIPFLFSAAVIHLAVFFIKRDLKYFAKSTENTSWTLYLAKVQGSSLQLTSTLFSYDYSTVSGIIIVSVVLWFVRLRRDSIKKAFSKTSQNSQENTCGGVTSS